MKKLIAMFAIVSFLLILVTACARPGTTTTANSGSSTTNSGANAASNTATVRLEGTTFAQTSITIPKGGSVTLVNDTATVHIIQNGTWDNGAAKSGAEAGAPVVNGLQFSSMNQSQVIGPFNTAGTFQLYCTVHPGMNLTIIVQ